MLACHITAAITACIIIVDMAIPLTRVNRLAAMRESGERITSIFTPFLRDPLRFTYALVCKEASTLFEVIARGMEWQQTHLAISAQFIRNVLPL